MLLLIISDTHDHLPPQMETGKILQEHQPDAVIHLGDYVAPFTLKKIVSRLPPGTRFYGVLGNNDGEKLGLLKIAREAGVSLSEAPLELELRGRKLLLVHGWGPPQTTKRIVEALASSGYWDVVLYGHTHERDARRIGSTLLLNPGEAGGALTGVSSAALLDLDSLEHRFVDLG